MKALPTICAATAIRPGWAVFLALACAAAPAAWTPAAAAPPKQVVWLTGRQFDEKLGSPVDLLLSGSALRPAISALSRDARVAMILDRRVDPEQQLEIKLTAAALLTVCREIAAARGIGTCCLGPVVYFGPAEAAAKLSGLARLRRDDARRLEQAAARRLLRERPLAWKDFATPREVLTKLSQEGGVEIAALERLPHDLWAAANLPALPWVDRVTLVVIQFDLTFKISPGGRQISLVAAPAEVSQPTAKHSAAPRKPPPVAHGKVVISRLVVQEKPVGAVLEELATRLKFDLRMDRRALEAAGIALDQRVSVKLESPTLDDVLRELLRATPLTYHRRGKTVEIVAKGRGKAEGGKGKDEG
jgi:hypothetical protein